MGLKQKRCLQEGSSFRKKSCKYCQRSGIMCVTWARLGAVWCSRRLARAAGRPELFRLPGRSRMRGPHDNARHRRTESQKARSGLQRSCFLCISMRQSCSKQQNTFYHGYANLHVDRAQLYRGNNVVADANVTRMSMRLQPTQSRNPGSWRRRARSWSHSLGRSFLLGLGRVLKDII